MCLLYYLAIGNTNSTATVPVTPRAQNGLTNSEINEEKKKPTAKFLSNTNTIL